MSYVLGATTLPNPKSLFREFVETSSENLSLQGRTTKDVFNRKERFILKFQNLTPAQVSNILSEYNAETTKNFSSTETNLTIAATPVHIEFTMRNYMKGDSYRSEFTLILTEEI
ncbi:unnamed protein product [marine sediment metagenome]|uniref:Uncharacterized protein n=1 Tax=marine sediment metagenome TaxID=412755 RepID=X1FQG5_9ZZZZ